MKNLDLETMESSGYFFLDIGLVPISWATGPSYSPDVDLEQSRGPFVIWWAEHQPATDVRKYCDFLWGRADPTGWYLSDDVHETSWSDKNNHRVEIVEDDHGRLIEFTISIDIRTPYSDFVDELIGLADAMHCVFFDFVSRATVDVSRQWVIKQLQEHEMNHVVFDSSGKLAPN